MTVRTYANRRSRLKEALEEDVVVTGYEASFDPGSNAISGSAIVIAHEHAPGLLESRMGMTEYSLSRSNQTSAISLHFEKSLDELTPDEGMLMSAERTLWHDNDQQEEEDWGTRGIISVPHKRKILFSGEVSIAPEDLKPFTPDMSWLASFSYEDEDE